MHHHDARSPRRAGLHAGLPHLHGHAAGLNLRQPAPAHAADLQLAGDDPSRLPAENCPYYPDAKGGYLAFLGRISPEKRPDRAIEMAIRSGTPLKIAAKVDKADQDYWDEVIEPMIHHPLVEYIGEINEEQKKDFLGNALALAFPIDWPEPSVS